MKIVVVSGSSRNESESRRVADFITTVLESNKSEASLVDLSHDVITTHLNDVWSNEDGQGDLVKEKVSFLEQADAAVFVTPEWNGMVTPALLNFIQLAGKSLAHKPVLIASVSSGRGGAYPITQLRGMASKNSQLVFIPEHLIFREVNGLLKGEASTEEDKYMRERTEYAVAELLAYAESFMEMRSKLPETPEKFTNGM